ncbi:Assembly factor cbp4 [Rhizina undulata]
MKGITIFKMIAASALCVIGGPALVYYVQPEPDELFKKYNPELQKRALAQREQRLKDHEEFLDRLKEYSKSDKHIWVVAAEKEKELRREVAEERKRIREEMERQKREIIEEQKRGP